MTTTELSQFRKQVYGFLDKEGFELTKARQITLSKLLKSIHEHRVVELPNQKPIEHKIVIVL